VVVGLHRKKKKNLQVFFILKYKKRDTLSTQPNEFLRLMEEFQITF
jgi:hypothetical protein